MTYSAILGVFWVLRTECLFGLKWASSDPKEIPIVLSRELLLQV
jgi:hypothetical protein